jgi:peptidoglycan-associated lipoprotein
MLGTSDAIRRVEDNMRRHSWIGSICITTLFAVGCSEEPAKTPADESPPADVAPPPQEPIEKTIPEKDPEKGSIEIGPKLAKLCDIPTAYFAFDSSALNAEAEEALQALASCFTEGNAKGKGMRLVGHADPRGTPDYNMALGQRRAGSVEVYLRSLSVPETSMESTSRGELDARGTDEESWAKDRKVQIFLADD